MGDNTAIEWAEATWNPTYGCTKIARPCANCYIYRTPPYRIRKLKFHKGSIPIELLENRITLPLSKKKGWREPKRIFVNSLSDLFHEDVPDWFIAMWVDQSEPEFGGMRMVFRGLDWVVVGGESGPQVRDGAGGARRALVEPCRHAIVASDNGECFTCHGSGWRSKHEALEAVRRLRDQCVVAGVPFLFKQWGGPTSKTGGRELDGRTWDEYPQGATR